MYNVLALNSVLKRFNYIQLLLLNYVHYNTTQFIIGLMESYGIFVLQLITDVCRNYKPVISSLMTYHKACSKNNTTGATSGAGTAFSCWGT